MITVTTILSVIACVLAAGTTAPPATSAGDGSDLQSAAQSSMTTDFTVEQGFLPGISVDCVPAHQESSGDGLPGSGGGKASLLIIRGLYYFAWPRFWLEGTSVMEWVWFNGYSHVSDTEGYIEVWLDNDDYPYGIGDFTLHTEWSGGPALFAWGHGFEITWPDHDTYPVLTIHVHAERTVDNFAPEVHDKWFYRHLFFQSEGSESAEAAEADVAESAEAEDVSDPASGPDSASESASEPSEAAL